MLLTPQSGFRATRRTPLGTSRQRHTAHCVPANIWICCVSTQGKADKNHIPTGRSFFHSPSKKTASGHGFSQPPHVQAVTPFQETFISCCLSNTYNSEKYKAHILKQVPCILKYMACIFCDKPCNFSSLGKLRRFFGFS